MSRFPKWLASENLLRSIPVAIPNFYFKDRDGNPGNQVSAVGTWDLWEVLGMMFAELKQVPLADISKGEGELPEVQRMDWTPPVWSQRARLSWPDPLEERERSSLEFLKELNRDWEQDVSVQ